MNFRGILMLYFFEFSFRYFGCMKKKKKPSKFQHEIYYHTYKSILGGFSNTSLSRHFVHNFLSRLIKSNILSSD